MAVIHSRMNPKVAAMLCLIAVATPLSVCQAQSMNAGQEVCSKFVGTAEMASCFAEALEAADRDLAVLYGRIQKVLEPQDLAGLKRAQRAWVNYREATCSAEYALYGGGTGGPPTRLACLAAEARGRHASLLRSYGWRLEKFGG